MTSVGGLHLCMVGAPADVTSEPSHLPSFHLKLFAGSMEGRSIWFHRNWQLVSKIFLMWRLNSRVNYKGHGPGSQN